jgi:hypothetical protein
LQNLMAAKACEPDTARSSKANKKRIDPPTRHNSLVPASGRQHTP